MGWKETATSCLLVILGSHVSDGVGGAAKSLLCPETLTRMELALILEILAMAVAALKRGRWEMK